MKKSGFSLVEIIVVTAVMGVVMLIFSPMISAFIGAQDRLHNQSKVDSRLNEVVEFIKRDVRNAKSVGLSSDNELKGKPVRVFIDDDDDTLLSEGTAGEKIIIYTIDLDGESKYIQYTLGGSDLKLKSADTFGALSSASSTTVLSDVEKCEFKYQDKILLFHFKIDVPDRLNGLNDKDKKVRNEVRDVGITRINLQ